jgi:hypothetical protein
MEGMSGNGSDLNWLTQHFILRLKDGVWETVYRARIKYTAKQKAEMWDRWQRGESLKAIG